MFTYKGLIHSNLIFDFMYTNIQDINNQQTHKKTDWINATANQDALATETLLPHINVVFTLWNRLATPRYQSRQSSTWLVERRNTVRKTQIRSDHQQQSVYVERRNVCHAYTCMGVHNCNIYAHTGCWLHATEVLLVRTHTHRAHYTGAV